MQQKSDNYVEGNGIGPPSGYNNVDHQLQNQRKFMNRFRSLLNQFIFDSVYDFVKSVSIATKRSKLSNYTLILFLALKRITYMIKPVFLIFISFLK